MRSNIYTLKPIKDLADKGFNPAALIEMERVAYQQAVMAMPGAAPALIAKEAANCLPQGVNLHSYYTQTLAGLMMAPLSKLEEVADEIQAKSDVLESAYVRVLARDPASFAEKARMQGQVAEDYASLIGAARELESRNVISIARSSRLQSMTEPSDGPLGGLYNKAMSILAARTQATHYRPSMSMAG